MTYRLWDEDECAFVGERLAAGDTFAEAAAAYRERFPDRPPRSAKAIENAKYKNEDVQAAIEDAEERGVHPPEPDLPPGVDGDAEGAAWDMRDYQVLGGHVLFVVSGKPLAIPFDRWDAICRDYSERGTDLTQAEVARRHGLPQEVLRTCLTKYRQFKKSPPAARERIEEHADDLSPLVAEAVENQEHRFIEHLDRETERAWRREYKELKKERLREDRFLDEARRLAAAMPPIVVEAPAVVSRGDRGWVGHAPTADEHGGKYVWGTESFGEDLDTDGTAGRIVRHGEATAEWIVEQPGTCRVLHRTFLGDLFHALTGATVHDTKLDQDTRGARVWNLMMEAILRNVATLSTVAERVVVRGAKGNHDGFHFYVAMYTLRHMAEAAGLDNVEVHPRPGHFDHFRVGTTLHVLDHGYGVGSLNGWKAKAQAETVARETGADDFHGCEAVYAYVGHKHENESADHGHLRLIRLPSMGESDDYETGLRYAARPGARLFRLREDGTAYDSRTLTRGDLT